MSENTQTKNTRLPLGNTDRNNHQLCSHWWVHDVLSESHKFLSMQRLGHAVSFHMISWAVLNVNVALGFLMGYKEESNIEMPGSFPSTLLTIFFKEHYTPVVLE